MFVPHYCGSPLHDLFVNSVGLLIVLPDYVPMFAPVKNWATQKLATLEHDHTNVVRRK